MKTAVAPRKVVTEGFSSDMMRRDGGIFFRLVVLGKENGERSGACNTIMDSYLLSRLDSDDVVPISKSLNSRASSIWQSNTPMGNEVLSNFHAMRL